MNPALLPRPWLGLFMLAATSILGNSFTRPSVNSIERERLLQAANEAIDQFPATIGPWRSESDEPLSDELIGALGCRAYQSRKYINDETGERVWLLLLAGSARPLATRAPQDCYEGEQFVPMDAATRESIGDKDTVQQLALQSNSGTGRSLHTCFAWRKPGGRWEAPPDPRIALGTQPMLFRVQVAAEPVSSDSTKANACRSFLADFIPAFDELLSSR
ncbi:MAG: exosortase-associated EpsI family protein [Planctomycetia bacterium]|nr:exosortase-associated EpsI family protein [Planctomycetia bacterium]